MIGGVENGRGNMTSNERWIELRCKVQEQIDTILQSRKGSALLSKRQESAIAAYEKALEIMSELWFK
jgi:predicted negative regulator of RcsB-dependent stress response